MSRRITTLAIIVPLAILVACDQRAPAPPATSAPIRTNQPAAPSPSAAQTSSPLATFSPAPPAPKFLIAFSQCDGTCDQAEKTHIWIANADGTAAKKIIDLGASPSFSPDGSKIVFEFADGIYVANSDGANRTRIVSTTGAAVPEWSRDGKWIVFADRSGLKAGAIVVQKAAWSKVGVVGATISGNVFINVVAPDGTQLRTLTVGNNPTWSPDGKTIAFNTCVGSTCGIYRVNAEGGEPARITDDTGGMPAWSPDGKQILYQADANNIKQIFSVNADGTGKKQLTSGNQLHVDGIWSPNGREIFYRSPEAGSWDIWAMNADGTNRRKIYGDYVPVEWGDEKLSAAQTQFAIAAPPTPVALATKTALPPISNLEPIPAGMGGLVLTNRYVQELEIDIGAKLYRVPPSGRTIVFLPPGRQTYSANVPGRGRLSGVVEVQLGKYMEVTFEE
ncbi:MAG: PD40 domain-containing protein [Chloroflexi bacterium]|nr:PD40 domain-containing protein [Chloroflexota bacterium]